jgi:hypothetical protein
MNNGLQTIIDLAESIQFDRRNVVGIQYTRSEIPIVSETPTRNAWKINVTIKASMPYNGTVRVNGADLSVRELLENIDDLDRRKPDLITFSNNPGLAYIGAYRGQLSQAQLNNLTVISFNGDVLVLSGLPTTASFQPTNYCFKSGDFIQIGTGTTYPYPFTIVGDVQRGTGDTITVRTHRPNFIRSNIVGQNITVGNKVYFKVLCTNMPVYTLQPGATLRDANGFITNNAYIEWSDTFKLYEWTGEA